MGLNLCRESYNHWVDEYFNSNQKEELLRIIQQNIGTEVDVNQWNYSDNTYERVGPYGAYNTFRIFLSHLTAGNFIEDISPLEEDEKTIIENFSEKYEFGELYIPHANHFLESGDCDTIFLPIFFKAPFEYNEIFFASKSAAINSLSAFGIALHTNLLTPLETEETNGMWDPEITAINIAKILYEYFNKIPSSCVVFS